MHTPMADMEFEKRYTALNEAQKKAVDAIEGPVMVIAGPGTGKTQILTLRIANILRVTDTNPENILALTFTEAGATNMRRRLVDVIGAPAYSVTISTFHGFCNSIIRDYPEEFPHIIGSESVTEVEQISLIEDLIREGKLEILRPFGDPLYYTRPILSAINNLKREGVDPDAFDAILIKEKKRFDETPNLYHEKGPHAGKMRGEYQEELKRFNKNVELAGLYRAYESRLRENKLYDYADMIMEVLRAIQKNKDILLILQEKYQYILVDEHQDTNNAQNKILELLANFHTNPNVFMVGDEKQAIFRFQGASLENFLYFKKIYPEAKLVILEENYRSTQHILDAAHSLIPGKRELVARAGHPNTNIRLFALSGVDVEAYFVGTDIKNKIDSGTVPGEVAVLYRDNADAASLIRMLERIGIPFLVESNDSVLRDNDMRKLLALLRAVSEFGNDQYVAEAMHIDFLKLETLDVYKVIAAANAKKIPIYDILRSDSIIRGLSLSDEKKIRNFYGTLSELSVASRNKGLQEFFSDFIRTIGFMSHILALPDAIEKMEKLNGFYDEIQKVTERHPNKTLREFIEHIDTIEKHNLNIEKSSFGGMANRVRLMTAHKSKGLEFEHVYIVGAFDGHWGNKVKRESLRLPRVVFAPLSESAADNPLDDERRLFYVALTRAKKTVTISYAKESISGREQLPSLFLGEMRPELLNSESADAIEADFLKHKGIIFAESKVVSASANDASFIRELFLQRGFSATSLNNYLSCPWKYFYQNLLRIPSAKTGHLMFGTAVHGALQDFFNAVSEEKVATKAFLLERFVEHLGREPFRDEDIKEWRKRGETSLSGYYDEYSGTWATKVKTEMDIKGILLTPEIKLSGKIDKLEIRNDRNEVNVVDYKTGKPKSRGEIEGSTKNSDGDIKRQLVFYNLLLNSYENGKYRMVSADVDFVEPTDSGKYKKEQYTILKEEIAELEETIKKAAEELLSLSFWDTRCDDKECDFCALRDMMR